ncbi:hypothetical protein VVD49_13460 [Uliginosibacterium sp. H3]|uniref:Uncharacterized protein n=1 Tax=Uliginosibacterium silvisoli TaxID=3114758 RepID=A0ABU6K584_9RHOO|nr:hypothetical protein [Uliginosibacterium sp. H3]
MIDFSLDVAELAMVFGVALVSGACSGFLFEWTCSIFRDAVGKE